MYRIAAALLVVGLLASCTPVMPTPYVAATESDQYGYSERWLGSDRVVVSFAGNSETPRDQVETYALYRAAQVARKRDAARFQVLDREVTRNNHVIQQYADPWCCRGGTGLGLYGGNGWGGGTFIGGSVGFPLDQSSSTTYVGALTIQLLPGATDPTAPGRVEITNEVQRNLAPEIRTPPPAA